MFNRLVGRTVFSDAYRIVCQYINDPNPHQCRQTHGRAHIIRKDKERAAVRNYATVQRHAVHNGTHCMFTNAVHNVVAVVIITGNGFHAIDKGQVGSGQIRRTADDLRNMRHDCFQTHFRSFACGDFGLFRKRFFF